MSILYCYYTTSEAESPDINEQGHRKQTGFILTPVQSRA